MTQSEKSKRRDREKRQREGKSIETERHKDRRVVIERGDEA